MGSLSNLCCHPDSKTSVIISTRHGTKSIFGCPMALRQVNQMNKNDSNDLNDSNVIVPLVWPNLGAILRIDRTHQGYDIYRALLPDPKNENRPTKLPFGSSKFHPVTETMVLLREVVPSQLNGKMDIGDTMMAILDMTSFTLIPLLLNDKVVYCGPLGDQETRNYLSLTPGHIDLVIHYSDFLAYYVIMGVWGMIPSTGVYPLMDDLRNHIVDRLDTEVPVFLKQFINMKRIEGGGKRQFVLSAYKQFGFPDTVLNKISNIDSEYQKLQEARKERQLQREQKIAERALESKNGMNGVVLGDFLNNTPESEKDPSGPVWKV